MNNSPHLRLMLGGLMLLLLAACVSHYSPALQRAQAKLAAVQQMPEVTEYAPRALAQAESALGKAEQAQAEDADAGQINHLAYLSEVRAEIARNEARRVKAERKLDLAQQVKQSEKPEAQPQQPGHEAQLRRLQQELSELRPRTTEQGIAFTLDETQFDFDSSNLKPQADYLLAKLVNFLLLHPSYRAAIGGHTDSQGAQTHNRMLSVERARAVEAALMRNGVAPARLTVRGYGGSQPVASNETEAGRSRNRRVEITLTDQPRLVR